MKNYYLKQFRECTKLWICNETNTKVIFELVLENHKKSLRLWAGCPNIDNPLFVKKALSNKDINSGFKQIDKIQFDSIINSLIVEYNNHILNLIK